MYYNECTICGAHLDPGEPCDCQDEKEQTMRNIEKFLQEDSYGQISLKEVCA